MYIDLGRFFLDLSKLTYAGLVLVAFAAWAVERKIGALEFTLIAIIATSIGSLFVWVGARLLKKGTYRRNDDLCSLSYGDVCNWDDDNGLFCRKETFKVRYKVRCF